MVWVPKPLSVRVGGLGLRTWDSKLKSRIWGFRLGAYGLGCRAGLRFRAGGIGIGCRFLGVGLIYLDAHRH